jgi:hypothetical protein
MAQQIPESAHSAPSAKAPLPAFAHLHAAPGHSRQTWQRERVLRDPVIFMFGKKRNSQVTLEFCRYKFVASRTSYAGPCEQGIRNG